MLARMADKPGSRCGNGAPRAERWNVSHNGSARPRSLETRKGRGFPHSHSDGDCGCQIGQTAKTRVNHAFFQILVQNQKTRRHVMNRRNIVFLLSSILSLAVLLSVAWAASTEEELKKLETDRAA